MLQYHLIAEIEAPATTPAGDIATDQRRRYLCFNLCDRAQNRCAWQMADRLARAWELGGCAALGVPVPEEATSIPAGTRWEGGRR